MTRDDRRRSASVALTVTGRDRTRRAAGLVLAVAAACNGAACNSAAKPPEPTATTGSAAAGATAGSAPGSAQTLSRVEPPARSLVVMDTPAPDLPRQESFQLLDPGKGARAPLRYALAAGTVAFTAQTTLSSRHLDGGQRSAPTALPAIRDGFAITVTADAAGHLTLRGLPGTAATTSPDADAYLAPWRTLLQDRTITVLVDDRGLFTTLTFHDDPTRAPGPQATDELAQRLLSTIVPLPAEPVAPGARWRVVTILKQGPAYAKQTATYTLLTRSPTRWHLHLKLQRVAEEQRIADAALPPGTIADLLAMFRALEGDVDVDPARPLIIGGSLTVESRLHVRLQAPGTTAAQASEQLFEDTGTVRFSHQP